VGHNKRTCPTAAAAAASGGAGPGAGTGSAPGVKGSKKGGRGGGRGSSTTTKRAREEEDDEDDADDDDDMDDEEELPCWEYMNRLRVPELKHLLTVRGLAVWGNKDDLVARLDASRGPGAARGGADEEEHEEQEALEPMAPFAFAQAMMTVRAPPQPSTEPSSTSHPLTSIFSPLPTPAAKGLIMQSRHPTNSQPTPNQRHSV
jgi:hypothetical protein